MLRTESRSGHTCNELTCRAVFKGETDKDSFIKVERKTRNPPCRNQCGTTQNQLLHPVASATYVYVSRLHYTTKASDIVQYLVEKIRFRLGIEKLETRHAIEFNSCCTRPDRRYIRGIFYLCDGREPFRPRDGTLPFLVYYTSRYRGLCTGTLVSRTAVITAAVCVANPTSPAPDTRPINVVTATTYRHPRRGIRVQVTKILLPKLTNVTSTRGYYIQKSPAILLLKRKVPDILAETPLRAIEIDYKGQETLTLHEECLMPGWHFFYKGDKIYPIQRFLLQRNGRVQFLNIEKKHLWCDTLLIKFQKALINIGYSGHFDKSSCLCVRDPDHSAQPCHGMYGAPLICHGKAVAMLMAPDAQWSNCTGFSNLVHLLTSKHIKGFMECVSRLFVPEYHVDWDAMKNSIYDDMNDSIDYLPDLYDKVLEDSSSSEEY